jgi:hypothetical protein
VPHLSSSGSRQAEWNSWISSTQAKTTFVTFFVFLQFLFIGFLERLFTEVSKDDFCFQAGAGVVGRQFVPAKAMG